MCLYHQTSVLLTWENAEIDFSNMVTKLLLDEKILHDIPSIFPLHQCHHM